MVRAESLAARVRSALPEVEFHIVGAEAPQSVVDLGKEDRIRVIGYAPDLDPVLQSMASASRPCHTAPASRGRSA